MHRSITHRTGAGTRVELRDWSIVFENCGEDLRRVSAVKPRRPVTFH
jgi:hypothetical protein